MKRQLTDTIESTVTKILKRDNLAKAHKFLNGKIPTPYQRLQQEIEALKSKKPTKQNGDHVLHWFRSDLRLHDNRALKQLSEYAKSADRPLITLYVVSAKDFQSHSLSNIKIDLMVRTLLQLKKKLQLLDIPLIIDSIEGRDFCLKLTEVCDKYNIKHVFANYEYEMDELYRDHDVLTKFEALSRQFHLVHDQCIVEPELIKSRTGTAFKMFKAWYDVWRKKILSSKEFSQISGPPVKNSKKIEVQEANENRIELWDSQKLDEATASKMKELYSDDESEIMSKCVKFVKEGLKSYEEEKDLPAYEKSSLLSPYINCGSISTRQIVAEVLGKAGKRSQSNAWLFIREVAWRDFYRHKMVEFPHVVMNLPFNLKTVGLEWENDSTKFEKWCRGETGFPIVDLSMRKLNLEGYINNRCRMIVSTFLVKNLNIDWRYGEEYFMTKLIDGDFASNNGGWGFVSSTGVNCQPFFRVFNPELQQQHYDHDLAFVKKWIPDFDEEEYMDPIVDYKQTKQEFIDSYRETL